MRAAVIIGAYALLNILAVFLVDKWLCKSSLKYKGSVAARTIVCFLYIAVAFTPVLATIVDNSGIKFLTLRFSYAWLGFLMYFGGILLMVSIVDLILVLIRKVREKSASKHGKEHDPEKEERRLARNRKLSALVFSMVLILSVGINVYGMIHARDTRIKEYNIKIDKKVKGDPYKIAMITDVHLVFNTSEKMMRRVVEMINKEEPNIVLVGGDLFSSSFYAVPDPEEYAKILSGIKSTEGTYFVYGNHDVEEPLFCGFALEDPSEALRTKEMSDFVRDSGFTALDDRAVQIDAGEIQLVGRLDGEKAGDGTNNRMPPDKLLENLDRNKPIIVLEHEPHEYKELAESGADLVLSGHTHAGQVFPGTIVTAMLNDMVYGYERRGDLQVIVSSGLGFYGAPLRIGTNSEIVVVNVNFDK